MMIQKIYTLNNEDINTAIRDYIRKVTKDDSVIICSVQGDASAGGNKYLEVVTRETDFPKGE